jgi:purine-nucleoside phosphorylase
MSTVPEVIAASASGLPCAVLSLVTNRATGLSAGPLSHEEVLEVGRAAGERATRLITGVLGRLSLTARGGAASEGGSATGSGSQSGEAK